jgi:hypothetical protein
MVTIRQDKQLSIESIVSEANVIWGKFSDRKVDPDKTGDEFYSQMCDEHSDFVHAYPVVLRLLCQFGTYLPKTFENYLRKIARHPWKTEKDFLNSQADYAASLARDLNPKMKGSEVKAYKQSIYKLLLQETEMTKEQLKDAEKQVLEQAKKLQIDSLLELKKFYESQPKLGDGAARVESDVQTVTSASLPHTEYKIHDLLNISADNLLVGCGSTSTKITNSVNSGV